MSHAEPKILPIELDVDSDSSSRFSDIARRIKRGAQLAVIAAEVSPLNEAMRLSAFSASQAISDKPLAGALAYGGSTLLLEGAAALSTASLFQGETSQGIFGKINQKMDKVIPPDARMSRTAETGIALIGGSAVVMAAKHRQDTSRTIEQNRRYGLKTTAWLAGICAVQGYAGSEVIHNFSGEKLGVAAIAIAGVIGAAGWAKKKVTRESAIAGSPEWLDINRSKGFVSQIIDKDGELASQALELESDIWEKKSYGDAVADYEKYHDQSRIFATILNNGEVAGVVRVFQGSPELPPFMELPISDPTLRSVLEQECENGTLEELGTVAVSGEAPAGKVSTSLWRLAYRDALARGVKTWGIIMEPKRVQAMNKRYGFTFQQVGETQKYQGGDCAVHIMDLYAVQEHMRKVKPMVLQWFVEEPLGK